jgi:DNA-binding transcriptional regulator YhcF (GntR family)
VNLFPIDFKAGVPVYEQVLYAARKAIISGELKPGDDFPSVRSLSAEYRINPNTVQKALTALKHEGLIESMPGVGNRVIAVPKATARQKDKLLEEQLEAVALRAKQLGLSISQVSDALRAHWKNL